MRGGHVPIDTTNASGYDRALANHDGALVFHVGFDPGMDAVAAAGDIGIESGIQPACDYETGRDLYFLT
jgi:hypothetical protein